ncbi:PREDICTED: uncharacterized protein LOC105458550 isoform X2 [Wasmannia auropunctata]|uniref:uncharacterized protein LOC105458550 isoform X2 n=1 Tax=Wasmannia auropunctata TaxID=64793 RepID=UPI0005F04180|nr:PREDICTED: uncharacterized protein LOC105458550 isoform X2 [Wasmannia auropunctata]
MSIDENFQRWSKKVMSKIIENFGSNIDEVRYEITERTDIYMSSMYNTCVKFKNRMTSQNEERSMILKRPMQAEDWRRMSGSDVQFHNEILFYRTYARPEENFPRCFYVDEKPPTDSVIALENVSKLGYYPYPYKYDVPLEYTLAAMREIGRFHGKGYVMKELQKEKFFDIVKQLQDSRYGTNDDFKIFVNSQAMRAVEYLRRHDHDAVFCDKMEALLSNAFDEVMMKTIKPLEPLSTLCHGDFTLSNVLFKTENGRHDAILIDFALCTYSTPVVDLSTYLCLCCPNELKGDKFFGIMRVYHDALKNYLLDAGISDIEKYSYEALLDDFRRGALFGFVITSFFLSMLRGCDVESRQTMATMEYEERGKLLRHYGGDEISKILANTLLHLKDLGCLNYF